MFSLALTLGAAVASTWFATPAAATSCTAFDSNFNLYGFGIKGRDFAFGPQSSWGDVPTGTVMPTTGRPPFDGPNTQCFTAEYFNSIYFINADSSQPNAIHIFDAGKKTWTTQQTTVPDGLDPTSMVAILDHDTNVLFAFSKGNLYQADMGTMTAAVPTPIEWGATNAPPFDASGYVPVMGLAQNHIHFLNHAGATNTDGQANIFVIHFAYWQPEVQLYAPGNNAGTFPQKHGQIASFFAGDVSVQKRFAFVPDDMSNTYVIDVEKNTTTVLSPPPASAGFASNPAGLMGRLSASPSALVYLSPANELHYLTVDQNNMAAAAENKWAQISSSELVAAAAVDPSATSAPVSGSASSTATGMVTTRATGSATGSASKPSGTTSANGASSMSVGLGASFAAVLVGVQAWLIF